MTEYYLALRHVHITCAILTIALFVLRGALMMLDSRWQHSVVLRYLPHAVDTVLLTTALMLTTVIRQYPFAVDWLTAKVVLLIVYIVLGSIALKRGRTRRVRIIAFAAALLTVAFLVSIARAHHPLGVFAGWRVSAARTSGQARQAEYPNPRASTTPQGIRSRQASCRATIPQARGGCYGSAMHEDRNLLTGLRGHHLFAGLAPQQLQRLLTVSHVHDHEAGHLLFDRGHPAQHFFIVLEGQVNLVLYSKTGEEKIVDIIGPGMSFAEAVMFMAAPGYPVSAVAATQSRVAQFPSGEYLAILRESPETCLRMLGNLSQRLHMRIREIEYLTLESATHRLVRLIESRLPADQAGPAEVTLQESRQELASRLSMKPETLSRILRTLADAGAVVVNGRVLQVPDRKRLLAMLDTVP